MPDDRPARLIGLQLQGKDFASALEEVWDAGDAVLPLSPGAPGPVLERLLGGLRPHRLVTPEGPIELPDPAPVEPGVGAVVATSGSAGAPKGVALTHEALDASARAVGDRIGRADDDRWLCCVPVHHIAGLAIFVRSRLNGVAPIVHAAFDPAAIADETRATLVSVVPTMLVRLLDAGIDISRWRMILLGGGPLRAKLRRRAEDRGAAIVTTYGMTETCGGCVYDGLPLEGVEAEVDAGGVIAIRGPVVMHGYHNRPDLTRTALRDGWFRTGDAGAIGGDGRLQVFGRADDVIVSGGEKVWSGEVEAALSEHPSVGEVAVIGRPDAEWGERVVAVVVPAEKGAPSLEELRAFVGARLERHKAPRALVVVPELPRLPSGKPDYASL